jgi:phenylacetate-CoA ligase
MASTIKHIIEKQPKILKKFLYKNIPFKYRYGKKYNDFIKMLYEARKWSYDQSINYQLSVLRDILCYSYNTVPYYKDLFNKYGFNPRIKDLVELKKLPVLTKDIVINNFEKLQSLCFNKKVYKMHTSGTTGKRLTVLGTDDLFKIESAFIANSYLDNGAHLYDDHSIWIRRYSPEKHDPIYFRDYELNRSYMSAFHLNEKSIFAYIDYINSTKSKILVSYPSTIYYLSILCEKFNLKLKYIQHIHGASEVCLPNWRKHISDNFGVSIKMHYGQIEKVSFAHQDLDDDLYKENLLYGYNEYLGNGTIIATGFYNRAMPLIRYLTNDVAKLVDNPKLTGAYPKTIVDILGRNGDMLLTDGGSFVPAVNFYSFMAKCEEVDMFQIIQDKETKMVNFYLLPNKKFNLNIQSKLITEIKNRLGNVAVNVVIKDYLERDDRSNKLRTVLLK